jgi:CubicO group peptidase (beta-lactamase class C family)
LDLHNPAWHTCPNGYPFAESDLFLRTHELARFAQLLLQQGEWEGRQLVPADYVRRMTSDPVDTSTVTYGGSRWTHGYGLGVWIDENDIYRMDGRYGQYSLISPATRTAVTVTAHSEDDPKLLEALHTHILNHLS